MKIIVFFAFLAVLYFVIYLLDLLIGGIAYPDGKRYLNVRLAAAVFVTAVILLNGYVFTGLVTGVDALINAPGLQGFFGFVLPGRAYEILYMLLLLFGLNIGLQLVTAAVTGVTRLVFSKKQEYIDTQDMDIPHKLLHLPWVLIRPCYEDSRGRYVLNSGGFNLYLWINGVKNSFLAVFVIETLLLALSALWGSETWNETLLAAGKAWYMLPFAMYLLLRQTALTLRPESDEYENSLFYSEVREELDGNINGLMSRYSEAFGGTGALLYQEAANLRAVTKDDYPDNSLGNYQVEDCRQPDVLQFMVEQLREEDLELSDSYGNVLQELLNGGSVFVRDYTGGEFADYLAVYLNYHLSQGRTALVICGDTKREDIICGQLNRSMKRLNALSGVWGIHADHDMESSDPVHILVCSWRSLLDKELRSRDADFAEALFCTVLTDVPELASADGISLGMLFDELRNLNPSMQYIAVSDEDNMNLRAAIQYETRTDMKHFSNDMRLPGTGLMVWKAESCYRLQDMLRIGEGRSPYMGTALPLALVAVNDDLPEVFIPEEPSDGSVTYFHVLSQSGEEVRRYLDKEVNLTSAVRTDPDELARAKDLCVAVVFDTSFNMFSAVWKWLKYGGKNGTLLHVISPPYMLRGYFASHFRRIMMNDNQYESMVPLTSSLDVSRVAEILMILDSNGMSDTELMERGRRMGWQCGSVEEMLSKCLHTVLEDENKASAVYEYFRFEQTDIPAAEDIWKDSSFTVRMANHALAKEIMDMVNPARMVINDAEGEPAGILKGNVSNYYLRDQLTVYGGTVYRVADVMDGSVYLEQVTPSRIPQYYPVSCFSISGLVRTDDLVDTDFMDLNLCRAKVERDIAGYWESDRGIQLCSSGGVMVHKLTGDGSEGVHSAVEKAGILEVSLRRSVFGGKADQAVNLLCFMLSELFKTLFPNLWQNVFVGRENEKDADLIAKVMSQGDRCDDETKVRSVIPWIARRDDRAGSGTEDFISLFIIEFSCVEYGIVQTLRNRMEHVFRMLYEYLSWYTQIDKTPSGKGKEKKEEPERYLDFGKNTAPDSFAPGELLAFLKRFVASDRAVKEEDGEEGGQPQSYKEEKKVCSYCGRSISVWYELEGGKRYMCARCHDTEIEREEILELYKQTEEFMRKDYGISFDRSIHVRFSSTSDIERRVGDAFNERLLGYYDFRKRELALETPGPRASIQDTLVHELTHRWQYDELDMRRLEKKLRNDSTVTKILEGHATYVEIDGMKRLHENRFAERLEADMETRDDEYGKGYRMIRDYISDKTAEGSHVSPFTAMQQYVKEIINGDITVK